MADSVEEHFAGLPDPRRSQGKRHRLSDMIVIAVCAVVCGADSWAGVADFGDAKLVARAFQPVSCRRNHGLKGRATRSARRKLTPASSP